MPDHDLSVTPVPFPLVPSPHEGVWRWDPAGTLTAEAPAASDFYVDPAREHGDVVEALPSAPTLLGLPAAGDLILSARVSVDFRTRFDAGVLLVWSDERTWAKLCFEYSPAGEPMVVSVVTRGVSDDANAFVVDRPVVWLRLSRADGVYAFHASTDGTHWQLVRVFSLGPDVSSHRTGFEAQSPAGGGCTVTFDEIRFDTSRLADLRDGS